MGGLGIVLAAAGWVLLAAPARAHQLSDSYLRVRVEDEAIRGQWSLALHDLEVALGLDADGNDAITWGELKAQREALLAYASSRLRLACDGTDVPIRFEPDLLVEQLANGGYAVLRWIAQPARPPAELTVEYLAFFDLNRLHRGLILVQHRDQAQQGIFNPVETRLRFDCARPQPWREFGHFVWEGVWHIWIGYDHILFLLCLLLPAVLHRQGGRQWAPVDGLGGAAWNVFKVVTAFTLAHSLTLSLASLEVVRLPSRWVEAAIAGSIIVAALNNLRPVLESRTWALAFGFGLIHGFGFASVLGDLGLPKGSLVRALIGFNLGVEAGQLAIVAVFLPLAHGLRRTAFYRRGLLWGGSVLVALLAAWWMVERLRGA